MNEIKEETNRKLTVDNIIKCLIVFMILFVSVVVVISMIKGEFDFVSISVGIGFILFLICLRWTIKEAGIE